MMFVGSSMSWAIVKKTLASQLNACFVVRPHAKLTICGESTLSVLSPIHRYQSFSLFHMMWTSYISLIFVSTLNPQQEMANAFAQKHLRSIILNVSMSRMAEYLLMFSQ